MENRDVDRLYGLEPEAFVPERAALAKRLRADGRREEAAAVAKLQKPSAAAWAVNQVVRTQRAEARALWDAGDALLAAQEALLAGSGDGAALREASAAVQAALVPLLTAARGLLDGKGRALSEATLAKVAETLHAAAIDPEAREEVAAGRVVRELVHVGLGAAAPPAAPKRVKRPTRAGEAATTGDEGRDDDAERRAAAEAERRAEEERHAREKAERRAAVRAAEAELEDAVHARAAAEEDVARARAALDDTERALEEARGRQRRAAAALARLADD